jgi:hypothetical protein
MLPNIHTHSADASNLHKNLTYIQTQAREIFIQGGRGSTTACAVVNPQKLAVNGRKNTFGLFSKQSRPQLVDNCTCCTIPFRFPCTSYVIRVIFARGKKSYYFQLLFQSKIGKLTVCVRG